MRRILTVAAAIVAVAAGPSYAQDAGANPYTKAVQQQFKQIHGIVMKSAEKIGEDLYSFKPTPEVRSIAQLLGHIADAEIAICTLAKGEKPAMGPNREKKTTRAELMAALNEAEAFCDAVFAATTDQNGTTTVQTFLGPMPKLGALAFNNNHSWEHYGNLVTYMRLKGIIPPTSEQQRPSQ
jgi:uncharacterized damage-inducible protein DinB